MCGTESNEKYVNLVEVSWESKKLFILNSDFEKIISMAALWYCDQIRPVPIYVLYAARRRTCTKFQNWETSLQRNRRTDRRIDRQGYINSARSLDQEYIYFMGLTRLL